MKQLFSPALMAFTFVLALSVSFTSCKKDPCKDVICQNGGACIEGACDCLLPYEGTNCEVRMTAKFAGLFTGPLTCFGQTQTETFTVTESQTHPDRLLVSYGGESFYGVVTSSSTFDIPEQSFTQGGLTGTLSGNGSLAGNVANLTMLITIAGIPVTCTFQGTKQ